MPVRRNASVSAYEAPSHGGPPLGAVAMSPEMWRDQGETRAPRVHCRLDQAEGTSSAIIQQAHRDGPDDAATGPSGRAGQADLIHAGKVVGHHLSDAALALSFLFEFVEMLSEEITHGVCRLELQWRHALGGEDPQQHLHPMLQLLRQ
jgi:hypothetical protein